MSDIPIIEWPEDPDELNDALEKAFKQIQGSTTYRNDRERPYNGQPQTLTGERGKTIVEGLTMRDIADCFVQGFLQASCTDDTYNTVFEIDDKTVKEYAADGSWRWDDVYKIKADFDPIAVIQFAATMIEHYMGIYPNNQHTMKNE